MLNTVSGVSAVNGSSVYLRARGDAANERDGVLSVHVSSRRPGGRVVGVLVDRVVCKVPVRGRSREVSGGVAETGRSCCLCSRAAKVYWSDVRRQRSNSFWAARGGISSP